MKQILLLEDDEGLNRGISLKLKKEGYEVFSAFTIKDARQFLEQESIDLLISDISLPDGSGMKFWNMSWIWKASLWKKTR